MEREGGLVVGGGHQGRRMGWGGTTSRFTLLPVPKEEGDSEQDDNGGARQDDIHVSNMEPLQVDRFALCTLYCTVWPIGPSLSTLCSVQIGPLLCSLCIADCALFGNKPAAQCHINAFPDFLLHQSALGPVPFDCVSKSVNFLMVSPLVVFKVGCFNKFVLAQVTVQCIGPCFHSQTSHPLHSYGPCPT